MKMIEFLGICNLDRMKEKRRGLRVKIKGKQEHLGEDKLKLN
jgi:hypothetical protein